MAKMLIDLKPEEVGVLSLVADCAKFAKTNPILRAAVQEVLLESTPRAQKIGALILDGSPERLTGRHGFMARRFIRANENNIKQMQILSSCTPRP